MASLARLAVHERIGEAAHVTGSHPSLGVHDDRAVKTHVIAALLHELLPPSLLYVVLELYAKRAVVPRVGKTAVDLGAGENKATVFTQGNNFVHRFFQIVHNNSYEMKYEFILLL